ncbi:unnamed protein product, partial [marine sediment metagenome]
MALTIQEPLKTVNGLLTKAIASLSQLLYQVQREDYPVTNTGLGASNKVRVVLTDTAPFTAGDIVYLKTDVYDELTTVLTVVDGTLMDVDIEYTVVSNAGYVNNLSTHIGYRIEVEIQDDAGVPLFDTIFKYVPNQAGFVTIDVGPLMSFFESAPDTFTFSKEYRLSMQEVWNGGSETPVITTTLQSILARKQLLKQGGANMWENLLREGADVEVGTWGFIDEAPPPNNGFVAC